MGSLTGPLDPLTAYTVQVYVVYGDKPVTVPCVEVPVMLTCTCGTNVNSVGQEITNFIYLDVKSCSKLCYFLCQLQYF